MGKLDGRVAFITGAARGQGRSHAVRLAEEGAAIIAMDICDQIESVFYPMATKDDLAETEALVTAAGGSIVTFVGDVRKRADVQAAYDAGVRQFGHVDIALPNAGIMPVLEPGDREQSWYDAIDTMLTGVWHTLEVVIPGMIERGKGGAIVITSSAAGLSSLALNTLPGQVGYVAAKHGVVGLMRVYASQLAKHMIRVNTVHPTGVNSPMVANEEYGAWAAANPEIAGAPAYQNPMPVPLIEPIDVSNAIAYLVSDEARYVTGVTFPVDAGHLNR
ncbi:dehydrogenase [Mycolicibacterium chitae]|uniref:3-ketoacyl-(Acyl-carrier-protein) reductase n=1 Tax=Mycolicibacterium chitae TaxID=1792 RepID=A0A3S4RFL1_MYCCI|nr:mycofactocin-coupled SDR family oxidoreductase [Mycolicibacterium chitae]MCV7105072.1 mycofactocin-coupled SDR family oxidoreductase [Mycolicibacterium chitae]BBZ05647.1 dehydrogenase [Mycolicibacterium chitae]VEG49259.1 3-ketoacyl-(acyl-carrier-protein) reductase [Mycolicibacterium chitae]